MLSSFSSVLFLQAFLAVASAADGDNFDFNAGANCKRFKCGSGQEPVQRRPLSLVSQGCSNMGGMSMMMPGSGGGQDEITPCCNLRQACFQTCGSSKSKCEDTFSKCVGALCAQNHPGDSAGEESCSKNANLMITMSKIGGCREWDSAQSAACQCVDDDRAIRRRTKTLEEIYKKVNPKKTSDVPKLAEKHGKSASKFSKLVVKLVRKYPSLIEVRRSREQEMMDAIRRGDFNADAYKKDDDKGESTKSTSDSNEVEDDADADEEVVVHDEV